VLENFTSNAIKYSPSGTTITARVLASPETIRFEVQDEGPGLTDEDKQKLFGFFQRLSARPTGGESSHGVGLAITKRVVDLHNGKIWAESEVGKGTTFIVMLPRNTDTAMA
jgi:signal transduction histidine kinase